ncbi:unnamed protein product [Closterium sp. NIES-65]|nr:unnamed protein product [Closterium sp. NIES-65]
MVVALSLAFTPAKEGSSISLSDVVAVTRSSGCTLSAAMVAAEMDAAGMMAAGMVAAELNADAPFSDLTVFAEMVAAEMVVAPMVSAEKVPAVMVPAVMVPAAVPCDHSSFAAALPSLPFLLFLRHPCGFQTHPLPLAPVHAGWPRVRRGSAAH